MILQASQDLGIDVSASLLVGDKDSDIQAGRTAGVGRLFKVSPSSACDDGGSDVESISALPDVLSRL
jgi:D-glycero-D-manno-heptose 1,7-bisphosphate phosphatase